MHVLVECHNQYMYPYFIYKCNSTDETALTNNKLETMWHEAVKGLI